MSHIRLTGFVLITGLLLGYGYATYRLDRLPPQKDPRELDAVLPRSAQLVMAAGDRYLAGNLASIRALIASPHRMTPDQLILLARVHEDAAWFNPANEDNYYVAANTLPWYGQLEAGQRVVQAAYGARPFDWLPAFYYGFDIWYFEKNGVAAGQWLKQAAARTKSESDRLLLETVGVRWIEHGYNTASAIQMLRGMAADARHSRLKAYYETRIQRLEALQVLEKAADSFEHRFGRRIHNLGELVENGLISAIPTDPFELGYGVNDKGRPVLLIQPVK